jgi:aminomethyltransferase
MAGPPLVPPREIAFAPRLKRSPFFEATLHSGAVAWTVYNHWLLPAHYGDPAAEYRALTEAVTLWDVAAQRQVEIAGPDARRLAQYLSPRDLSKVTPGQCRYVVMCADDGGIVNDPVMTCLDDDRFWFSAADSDVELWARGIAHGRGFNASIRESEAAALQLQGPSAPAVAAALGIPGIETLRYFRWVEAEIDGARVIVSRTGWSGERGYEFYLLDTHKAEDLWEAIMAAGAPFGIAPAAPNQFRRIESAFLSYGADMDLTVNPFELGLGWTIDLDQSADFVGKAALQRLARDPPARRLVGLSIDGPPILPPETPWRVEAPDGRYAGRVSSACHSPGLQKNIGLALVGAEWTDPDTPLLVLTPDGARDATVTQLPFVPSRAGDAARP